MKKIASKKKAAIQVKSHVRAGEGSSRLFDSQNSDARLKKNVREIERVLARLAELA